VRAARPPNQWNAGGSPALHFFIVSGLEARTPTFIPKAT